MKTLDFLEPEEVLYFFDGPLIFTTRDPITQNLLLAYFQEDLEEEKLQRFLMVSTTETIIQKLKESKITVRNALLQQGQEKFLVVDVSYNYQIQQIFDVQTLEQLPSDALPESGIMLYPNLP